MKDPQKMNNRVIICRSYLPESYKILYLQICMHPYVYLINIGEYMKTHEVSFNR